MDDHTIKLAILLKVEKILFEAVEIINKAYLITASEAQIDAYKGITGSRKSMLTIKSKLEAQLEKIQTKIKNPKQYQKATLNKQGSNIAFNSQAVLTPSQMIPPGFYTATIPSRVRGAPSPKRNLKPSKSPEKQTKYMREKEGEFCAKYKQLEPEVFWLHKRWRQALTKGDFLLAEEINREKMKTLEEMGRLAKYCQRSSERSPTRHGNASPNVTISALQRQETLTQKEKEVLQRRIRKREQELEKFLPYYIERRGQEKRMPSYLPVSEKTFIRNLQKPSPSAFADFDEELEYIPKPWSANKFYKNPEFKGNAPF